MMICRSGSRQELIGSIALFITDEWGHIETVPDLRETSTKGRPLVSCIVVLLPLFGRLIEGLGYLFNS